MSGTSWQTVSQILALRSQSKFGRNRLSERKRDLIASASEQEFAEAVRSALYDNDDLDW